MKHKKSKLYRAYFPGATFIFGILVTVLLAIIDLLFGTFPSVWTISLAVLTLIFLIFELIANQIEKLPDSKFKRFMLKLIDDLHNI